ncbi:MAG: hypothetical protein ACTS43_01635 [Candidatus Hodgkinia cicadicola]
MALNHWHIPRWIAEVWTELSEFAFTRTLVKVLPKFRWFRSLGMAGMQPVVRPGGLPTEGRTLKQPPRLM